MEGLKVKVKIWIRAGRPSSMASKAPNPIPKAVASSADMLLSWLLEKVR